MSVVIVPTFATSLPAAWLRSMVKLTWLGPITVS